MSDRPSPNDLYTVREIMMLFKISRRSLTNWINRGLLSPRKFGGKKLLFMRADIEAMMRSGIADENNG